jgi:Rad3-related DNA helicase
MRELLKTSNVYIIFINIIAESFYVKLEERPSKNFTACLIKKADDHVTKDRLLKGLKTIRDMIVPLPELISQILGLQPVKPCTLPAKLLYTSLPGIMIDSIQQEAIEMAVQSNLCLIQGPAGSGKTIVSALIAINLFTIYKKRILVCAPSNGSVANLTKKIGNVGLNVKFFVFIICRLLEFVLK